MVMFHRIPYAEARRLGAIQDGILDELTRDAKRIDEVDFSRADLLVEERLPENALVGGS
jgi:kynurenine 3-monooxygenase